MSCSQVGTQIEEIKGRELHKISSIAAMEIPQKFSKRKLSSLNL